MMMLLLLFRCFCYSFWCCCCFCFHWNSILWWYLTIGINAVYKCELCECNCIHLFILVFNRRIVSFWVCVLIQLIHTYTLNTGSLLYLHSLYIFTKSNGNIKNKGDQVNRCYRKRFWCFPPHSNSVLLSLLLLLICPPKSHTIFHIHRISLCKWVNATSNHYKRVFSRGNTALCMLYHSLHEFSFSCSLAHRFAPFISFLCVCFVSVNRLALR